MNYLGKNIKLIRKLSEVTQKEFGQLLKVSGDAIYTYETGRTTPDNVALMKIAKIAGVTVEDLKNKNLSELIVHLKDPDTKKMEFKLAPQKGANQHDVQILKHENENLREALKQRDALLTEKDKRIDLLEKLVASSSKKS